MTPSFSSYLVNDPFGDPGLYVEIKWARGALLFDLGEHDLLSPTRILRANDIFISHTHLKELKPHIWQDQPDDFSFIAMLYFEHRKEERAFRLGDVKSEFITITRGQKLVYVVDVRYDDENEAKIIELARDADVFYCESPYLDCDADKARERYHLTARQAGIMARKAGVRDLVVFRFSPRYTGQGDQIVREAHETFAGLTQPI